MPDTMEQGLLSLLVGTLTQDRYLTTEFTADTYTELATRLVHGRQRAHCDVAAA